MWAWRQTIVIATCLATGCALVGCVEWYALEYGFTDLICRIVDPATSYRCEPTGEPAPKLWLAAAVAFGSLALAGLARIELDGRRPRVEHIVAGH